MVAVEAGRAAAAGGRDRLGLRAAARSTLPPASFARSSSLQPRRMSSANRCGILRRRPPAPPASLDAVEVAADADVVDARHLAHVLDVVGHLRERRLRLRRRGLRILLRDAARLVRGRRRRWRRAQRRLSRPRRGRPPRETKPGTNVTITTPPFAGMRAQDVVGHVARVVDQRARAASARRSPAPRDTSSASFIVSRRDVARCPPACPGGSSRARPPRRTRVRPAVLRGVSVAASAQSSGHVVGERHVAHAEVVVGAQRAEASSRSRGRPPCPRSEAMRPCAARALDVGGA